MKTQIDPYLVLAIEDNPGDYVLLQHYLEWSGLPLRKILLADSIAAATKLISENNFDLVLLDLTLPDSSGLDSVIALNKLLPKIPIIVLSGIAIIDMAIESISLGAQDYLVKGEFDENILLKSIQYSLERKKTQAKLEESEETFRRLFYESADPILLLDETGFRDCNQAAVAILGYASNKEIIGKFPWEISPEKQADGMLSKEKAELMIAKAKEKGFNQFEWIHLKDDGTEFIVEVMLTAIMLQGKQVFYTVWRDITERKKTEGKLHETLEWYELVQKATHDIIWDWDLLKNEITRSHSFRDQYGFNEGSNKYDPEWTNEHIHPIDKERVKKSINGCIENKQEKWEEEYRLLIADGTYKYVYDRAFLQFNKQGKPLRMIGSMTDLTEKKKLQEDMVEQQLKQQKQLLEVNILAHEEEKNELGRELHDNINQILATVKIYLGMIRSGKALPQDDLLGKSYHYIDDSMNELRKLSHSLVAPSLGDMGVEEALRELVEEMNLVNNNSIHLLVAKDFSNLYLDKNIELMIYRIVQEQLNNIYKYAKASHVIITLKKDTENLLLSIKDDGVGFDVSKKAKGIGLKNISSRVEFYSGDYSIISSPGNGCTLQVNVPLNNINS